MPLMHSHSISEPMETPVQACQARHTEPSKGFSFREYLKKFGIVEESDFQDHCKRVLQMEAATGYSLRLDWYDPFNIEGYSRGE